ncbi:MAG: thioredoxin reductase [Thermoprotei archaeon]|nr:MAG: thioredoxin reductase [Thermoprotei archaeon]
MVEEVDVVVIGGGIAGLSAALYTARQGLRTVVVSIDVGGQLTYASLIENYPGVEPVKGLDLAMRVQKQAMDFGAQVVIDEVVKLSREGSSFVIETGRGWKFKSLAVIAACGKAPRRLGVDAEERFVGKGLSYCVVCDGPLYRGREVALVSFGEKGVEGLEFLAPLVKKLHYIVPREKDPSIEVAKRFSNVEVYPRYRVVDIYGENRVEAAKIARQNEEKILKVDAVFVEMGFETRIDFLKPYVDINEKGEVVADIYGQTRTPGLFAAGDLASTPYKQAVIAAASGVVAALTAINYVNKLRGISKSIRADWGKKRKAKRSFRL